MTVAAPVMGGEAGREVVAAVVAIVSFQEVFEAVHQSTSKSERELLDAGLPVVFVVDQNGRAVAHPEASVAFSEKPMTDLKVVRDWQESGNASAVGAGAIHSGSRRAKRGHARLIRNCRTGQELTAGRDCDSG